MEAYHFLGADRKLGYGDGREVKVGETLKVDCPLVLCQSGLHASKRAIDALRYARGSVACRVRLGGQIVEGDDKVVATERTCLSMIDAGNVLMRFARLCALDVSHLWGMPDIVRRYLETGDQAIRGAAWEVAKDAARAADAAKHVGDLTWEVAEATARAAAAAKDAAGALVWEVSMEAARAAAWQARGSQVGPQARAAAVVAQNTRLEEMLKEAGL